MPRAIPTAPTPTPPSTPSSRPASPGAAYVTGATHDALGRPDEITGPPGTLAYGSDPSTQRLASHGHMALGGYVSIPAGLVVVTPTLVAPFGFGGYGQLGRRSWGAGEAGLDLAGAGCQRAASGLAFGAIEPPHSAISCDAA